MNWFSNFYGRVQNPLPVARDPFDNAVIKAAVASLGREFWFRTKRAGRIKSALSLLPKDSEGWGEALGAAGGGLAGLRGIANAIPKHVTPSKKLGALVLGSTLLGGTIGHVLGGHYGRVKDIKNILKQKTAASVKAETVKLPVPTPKSTPNPNSYGAMRKKMLSEL